MDSFAFFFSPGAAAAGAEFGLSERASERGTNVVMKIYGPNYVALVEFFLP